MNRRNVFSFAKGNPLVLLPLFFLALLELLSGCGTSGETTSITPLDHNPPNFVFILVDDLGWAELGCYGNGFNETRPARISLVYRLTTACE